MMMLMVLVQLMQIFYEDDGVDDDERVEVDVDVDVDVDVGS